MSKRKTRTPAVPYWQTEPCPRWCVGGHRDAAAVSERKHLSRFDRQVTLTLHDPDVTRVHGETYVDPAALTVCLEQTHREAGPRVVVFSETTRPELPDLELTPDEAVKLGQALVDVARIGGETR